jgi:hypothetical protein
MGWISLSWAQFFTFGFLVLVFFTQEVNLVSMAICVTGVLFIQTIEMIRVVKNRALDVHYCNIKDDAIMNAAFSLLLFGFVYFDVSFTINGKSWNREVFHPSAMVFLVMAVNYCSISLILPFVKSYLGRRKMESDK